MDSRQRPAIQDRRADQSTRLRASTNTILGLYLDQPKTATGETPCSPATTTDASASPSSNHTKVRLLRSARTGAVRRAGAQADKPVEPPKPPPGHRTQLFEPGTTLAEWDKEKKENDPFKDYIPEVVRRNWTQDGLDTDIYGYPSGIFGLRLFLNLTSSPKRPGRGEGAQLLEAASRNDQRTLLHEKSITPTPPRPPFRVSMSCGSAMLHTSAQSTRSDDEPEWRIFPPSLERQYWIAGRERELAEPLAFLHHFLKSQAPGTIDSPWSVPTTSTTPTSSIPSLTSRRVWTVP